MRRNAWVVVVMVACGASLNAQTHGPDGNRLAYLDEVNPYYPHRHFPKLTTPQWIGDKDVEAVIILGIDDMRESKPYEKFLRPILNRLKKIDGRAPVSIMTNRADPNDPQLQAWLNEGLSLECHTYDHPCPFFQGGFEKAKLTYDKCVDMMQEVPGNKPVAFRMPCCDSMNTPSPRFYAEIFNKSTSKGHFLSIDTSVFNVFTPADPELPRELVCEKPGQERFKKYLPADRDFVNYIENYPYPYVLGRLCWEFPCVTPSDWQAQHLHKSNNPLTVRDMKAALDCTVIKQGVYCLVFHPHGWIKNEQIVDLIDHAVQKHGAKVKFLTFREALERLQTNVLQTSTPRDMKALDRFFARRHPELAGSRRKSEAGVFKPEGREQLDLSSVLFVDLNGDGKLDFVFANEKEYAVYVFNDSERGWKKVRAGKAGDKDAIPPISRNGTNNGCWVHSGSLWWANEDTVLLKNHVDRRSFKQLLGKE